jgi:hypothetical protein
MKTISKPEQSAQTEISLSEKPLPKAILIGEMKTVVLGNGIVKFSPGQRLSDPWLISAAVRNNVRFTDATNDTMPRAIVIRESQNLQLGGGVIFLKAGEEIFDPSVVQAAVTAGIPFSAIEDGG